VVNWLSPELLAQEVHSVIGAAVVFGAWLLLRPWTVLGVRAQWIAVAALVAVVMLKETLWDPVNEVNQPFLWAGATDAAFYAVGILVALALIYARWRAV
jgi:hypothetical protein